MIKDYFLGDTDSGMSPYPENDLMNENFSLTGEVCIDDTEFHLKSNHTIRVVCEDNGIIYIEGDNNIIEILDDNPNTIIVNKGIDNLIIVNSINFRLFHQVLDLGTFRLTSYRNHEDDKTILLNKIADYIPKEEVTLKLTQDQITKLKEMGYM